MAISNFHVKDTEGYYDAWDNVLATWDTMYKDLGKYYAYYIYFIETDNSSEEYLRVAKQLSSSDSWRLQIKTGYYQNGVEIVGTAAGYFPTFNHWELDLTSPGDYTLSRASNTITITNSSNSNQYLYETQFKEHTIPYYIGVAVHGAGGGGGGTWGSDDGTGGGAGGFIAGVLKLDINGSYTLHVGAGGAGGYKKEVSSVEGKGQAGGTTSISTTVNGSTYSIFLAGGGGPGRNSTKSNSYAGGNGGTYQSTNYGQVSGYANCATGANGGNGGKVYGLSNATGMGAQTVRFTNLSDVVSEATHKTFAATKGGAQGDNNAPGGGGGGREHSGPAGGGYSSDGKAGEPGCGGSGARYTMFTYKRGGKGGNGYIKLFY